MDEASAATFPYGGAHPRGGGSPAWRTPGPRGGPAGLDLAPESKGVSAKLTKGSVRMKERRRELATEDGGRTWSAFADRGDGVASLRPKPTEQLRQGHANGKAGIRRPEMDPRRRIRRWSGLPRRDFGG